MLLTRNINVQVAGGRARFPFFRGPCEAAIFPCPLPRIGGNLGISVRQESVASSPPVAPSPLLPGISVFVTSSIFRPNKGQWIVRSDVFRQKKWCLYESHGLTIRSICVNDFIAACLVLFHLSRMWVDTAVSILPLAGDCSWTLACPAHCGSGSVISFLAGLSTGLLTSLLLRLFLSAPHQPSTTASRLGRLSGFLHE